MRWLCIEVHFLAGRYHGKADDGRTAQWPPNPHRLFQALVAAGNLGIRRTDFSDAKKGTLRWLERRPAPEIVAPHECAASALRLYVPNNDMDKVARAWADGKEPEKQPNELRTDKDLHSHRLDGDATARFLWPIEDSEWPAAYPHAEILCGEAAHLHALGLGIDLVAARGRVLTDAEKASLPGEVWIPQEGIGWRVTIAGSLDELLLRHEDQRLRLQLAQGRGGERWVAAPAPPSVYDEVLYVRRAEGGRRPVHLFSLDNGNGGFHSFDPRCTMEVAGQLRHAAHQRAKVLGLDPVFVERFVCGHGESESEKNDRFSYLPLPTLPAKGRDGRIRRVMLAEPFGSGNLAARHLARALSGAPLVDEKMGEIVAELRSEPFQDTITNRYLRKSHQWSTVTPLVLPGRDDYRSSKAHTLVLKALAQAGYTTPILEIHLQHEPVFAGAEMARAYRVPAYLKSFPRTHAVITFDQEISGPVAIGGGRHIGLGIFANLGG
jgi:CRISPR-associated protein Csb2